MSEQTPTANILVVDDTPANLQLLTGMLKEKGYRTRPCPNGTAALRAAAAEPPDLILLDINMPDIDGYEVCRRLKADDTLKEIPVIFISALSETMDKVEAFHVGGVDYVTKPFQFEEVEARVETHLQLRRQQRQLQEQYNRLKELEQLRDGLVHMIVHDMRTPLMGISGFLQLAEMQELPEKAARYVAQSLASSQSLIEMVSSLLDVSKMESGQMELDPAEHDLKSLVSQALAKVEGLKGRRTLTVEAPGEPVPLTCDGELVTRTVQNLVGNALKFTDEEEGSIRVVVEPGEETIRVSIRDNGPGIPEEYREKIFEKFGQVEMREQKHKYSTGLGLTFCKLAVEAHDGTIGVDSVVGEGSTFWFELPRPGRGRRMA